MPLTIVQAARRVQLVAVDAYRVVQGRSATIGLVLGAEIEVLRDSLHGPSATAAKGSRITLRCRMAQKILVA